MFSGELYLPQPCAPHAAVARARRTMNAPLFTTYQLSLYEPRHLCLCPSIHYSAFVLGCALPALPHAFDLRYPPAPLTPARSSPSLGCEAWRAPCLHRYVVLGGVFGLVSPPTAPFACCRASSSRNRKG